MPHAYIQPLNITIISQMYGFRFERVYAYNFFKCIELGQQKILQRCFYRKQFSALRVTLWIFTASPDPHIRLPCV